MRYTDQMKCCSLSLMLLATVACSADPKGGNGQTEASAIPSAPQNGTVAARVVTMGDEANLDACGGYARVKEGRTVVVRSAPETAAAEVDRLNAGAGFFVCDSDKAAPGWLGIAYEKPGQSSCAAVASTAPPRTPVPATCASGWVVLNDEVELVAG
jgi:hypothetical protein